MLKYMFKGLSLVNIIHTYRKKIKEKKKERKKKGSLLAAAKLQG